jgi:hypothetical protein
MSSYTGHPQQLVAAPFGIVLFEVLDQGFELEPVISAGKGHFGSLKNTILLIGSSGSFPTGLPLESEHPAGAENLEQAADLLCQGQGPHDIVTIGENRTFANLQLNYNTNSSETRE